jgi:hypothetical protein
MFDTVYIAMNRKGAVRMTKGKPALRSDEIAIGITVEVPDSAFRAPIIMADLKVPDHAVMVPEISVEVIEP